MNAAIVTLEPETHTYRLPGGEVVPGVTRLLRPLIDLAGIPKDVLEAKADLGRRVHAACHYLSENDLEPSSVEPDVAPYLAGFERFIVESGARIVANERIVHSQQWGYAGQLDLIADIERVRYLIDIKSCVAVPMSAGPQTAAYHRALGDPTVTHRAALRLKPDGRYVLEPLNDPNDWSAFLAALTLYRYREAYGK